MRRGLVPFGLLCAIACALIGAGSASAASIWTPVASGTAGTISAIATPKAGEVVFTTTAGKIFHSTIGGGFAEASLNTPMPFAFEDVAMSPAGTTGIAVGEAGRIYRTTTSGIEWTQVVGVKTRSEECGGTEVALADNLFSVHFASATVVYATGAMGDVLKSTDGGASFTEVNKGPATCLIHDTVGDTYWRSDTIGYLLSNDFGAFYRTTDGLGGSVGATTKLGSAVNGFEGTDRLAVDADDPLRMWATNPGSGLSYFQYSVNGGTNWSSPTLTDGATKAGFFDIGAGIGTNVVAVGAGGAIYTSLDGINFVPEPADAPNATTSWEAVAFQPGSTTAWVGGANGALLTTNQANVQPVAPVATPPVSITPPAVTAPIATTPKPKPKPRCKVPSLKGRSLKIAAKKLKAAHCALGKVTKKEGATAKGGEVSGASQKPGKSLPAGTKIKVTLTP